MSKLTKAKYWFDNGESAEFYHGRDKKGVFVRHTWRVRLEYVTGDIIEIRSMSATDTNAKKLLNAWREDKT